MGIHGLFQLLKNDAQNSFKFTDKSIYNGKIIAIDATILLYQFLVQIRTKGDGYGQQLLVDDNGDITSHIQGFFNRTANMLENGIKPIFVFDGKPPALKYQELSRRKELKKKAEIEIEETKEKMKEFDNIEDIEELVDDLNKASKRNIHITQQHINDIKLLLDLMGVPVINAPCEAEAQCVELVKSGKAFAVGTEDMDALTFGANVMLRKLTMPKSSKEKVIEINLLSVLSELKITYDQFIDICILCGCDYCDSIKGIGPKTALKLIHKHINIENIIDNLSSKYIVPDNFISKLDEVRHLFKNPEVIPSIDIDIKFKKINKEALVNYLVESKGFNKDRVINILDRLSKNKIIVDTKQPKIDNFFKPKNNNKN